MQEDITKVSEVFKSLLNKTEADLFNSYDKNSKLRWMQTLNFLHPAPCKTCGTGTKPVQGLFKGQYCSYTCRGEEWLNNRRATCLEKYGLDNAVSQGNEKRQKTCLAKYGSEYAVSSTQVQSARKKTLLERYGVDNASKMQSVKDRKANDKMKNFIDTICISENLKPLFDINEYKGLKHNQRLKWECGQCAKVFACNWYNYRPHCPKCNSVKNTRSLQGKFFNDLLAKLNINAKQNDRTVIKPLEIDICFTQQKLAIEINGFYWHSMNDRTEEKRELLKSKGWKFMMFFEDEIVKKPDVVMSMISHKLKITPNWIHARKCTVEAVATNQAKELLDEWHLSGWVRGGTALALKHDNEIVALALFGKERFTRKDKGTELLRFCTKPFFSVRGGLSKLISAYKVQAGVSAITSFADRRLDPLVPSNAKEQKNGFVIWDNRHKKRIHRLAITKSSLRNRINNFDVSKTQEALAIEAGFLKINTLGVFKYEL